MCIGYEPLIHTFEGMSNYPRYPFVEMSSHFGRYQFTSIGPKGHIKMVVQFIHLLKTTYNLAFGKLNQDGSIDDQIENNNKDRDTILATVVDIVSEFTSRYPGCQIFFAGSTPARTRLYRMAITINFRFLDEVYEIAATTYEGNFELFQPSCNYDAFLIKRK